MRYTPDRGCPYQDAVAQTQAQAEAMGYTVRLDADQLWRVRDHAQEVFLVARTLGAVEEWLNAEAE